ncbi:MAG: tRNA (guanosine(37)-N1)-methyltransferase TrmD [Candidatus Hydrogenedentes bacterium]|nr:tRNA (guanosine(37)-N1)-methyltransferase TrmD [Candidatus Hydrogenedentota bacterium]
MRIDILTIFPEILEGPLEASLLGKAIKDGLLDVEVTDIRDFSADRHRSVDDAPYGGGAGMVMQCEPLFGAVESLRGKNSLERVILLSPRGRRLDQAIVRELAQAPDMALICGRYEGVDERVRTALCTDEISIGDYVLSGGELPALVLVEAVSRMLPGVVGKWESVETDSFYAVGDAEGCGILGPPQYTRPAEFRGLPVPDVLMSGNHAAIRRWRRKESLRITRSNRPDLLAACTSVEDQRLLAEIEREEAERERENTP